MGCVNSPEANWLKVCSLGFVDDTVRRRRRSVEVCVSYLCRGRVRRAGKPSECYRVLVAPERWEPLHGKQNTTVQGCHYIVSDRQYCHGVLLSFALSVFFV